MDEVIFIKQLILAEDISWGLVPETQVRNGITLTGSKVNATHLLYNNPGTAWHGKSVNDILTALITSTGIVPTGA